MNKDTAKRATEVDKSIGARVRMRRLEVGMTQEELATFLGVSFQQIQKYEKGTNGIRGSRMQQIATQLNADISFFYGDDTVPAKTQSTTDRFISSPLGVRMAVAFMGISPTAQRRLVELTEAFADEVML